MLCPYRASFVTHSFTQGVAIGLDPFKPFQGFSIGYQYYIYCLFIITTNDNKNEKLTLL